MHQVISIHHRVLHPDHYLSIKLKPATIVTIQVPVPILSGTANNGLGIQKSITNKITLISFGYLTVPYVNKEINNPKDS